jgi:hypothetical protein
MTKQEGVFQSLATSGAVLITFIGVCHEFLGDTLFPWGPALFGGPIGWHGLGISAIIVGVLLAAGTLRVMRFPIAPVAFVVATMGLAVFLFTAIAYGKFHLMALTIFIAAIGTAVFDRKAMSRLA